MAGTIKTKARTCLFVPDCAEEAARFYCERIPGSTIESIARPDPSARAFVVEFTVAGAPFMAMNGNPEFRSTHSFSISVLTDDQSETDALWSALLEDGGKEGRCGWLEDRFGVHWQIVPTALPTLMGAGGEVAGRVQEALMTMSKIDIAALQRAAEADDGPTP